MPISRREFLLGGAAATLLASCGKSGETPTRQPGAPLMHLRDVAEQEHAQFIDSDGKIVNLAGLQAQVNNHYSTMSFMFAACGDICPLTATELARVSQDHPDIKHIVISVDPLGDFTNKNLYNTLSAQGLRVSGLNANTIILYPTSDGTTKPTSLITSNAAEIEQKFHLLADNKAPEFHSGAVTLFDPRGNLLAQSTNGPSDVYGTLSKYLPQQKQR